MERIAKSQGHSLSVPAIAFGPLGVISTSWVLGDQRHVMITGMDHLYVVVYVEFAEQAVGAEAKGTIFLKNVQTRFPEMLRNIFDSSP